VRVAEEQLQEDEVTQEQNAEEAWREVGREFEALGESLSQAFRSAWKSEQTQQHVRSMQRGVEQMLDKVDRTVKEAGESPQAEKIRAEAEKTATTLQKAGEHTWQEAHPRLLAALQRLNAELERIIETLEERSASEATPPEDLSSAAYEEASPEVRED
jgi:hypothetical protein